MLRLRIGQKAEWVDSSGRVRSGVEDLTLLTPDAKALVDRCTEEFTVWAIGVVADDWPRPDTSKALERDGSPTVYALDADEAGAQARRVAPLWCAVITWMTGLASDTHLFIKDEVWDGNRWGGALPMVQRLAKYHDFRYWQTLRSGLIGLQPRSDHLGGIFDEWWPSAAGFLAGLGFVDDSGTACETIRAGEVSEAGLGCARWMFQTSRSFHNLGLTVLMRGRSWSSIESELARHGWNDGCPVEYVISESE